VVSEVGAKGDGEGNRYCEHKSEVLKFQKEGGTSCLSKLNASRKESTTIHTSEYRASVALMLEFGGGAQKTTQFAMSNATPEVISLASAANQFG
jgi:hypothetical protein